MYEKRNIHAYKQGVTGSNPVGPTVTKTRLPRNWEPFLLPKNSKRAYFYFLYDFELFPCNVHFYVLADNINLSHTSYIYIKDEK